MFRSHFRFGLLLVLVGTIISMVGCGFVDNGDGSPSPKTSVTVKVRIPTSTGSEKLDASAVPSQVASVVMEVRIPDCDSPIVQTATANVTGQDSVTFTFELPSGSTACFIAKAFSESNGQGTLLFQGSTSGVVLPGGMNITAEVNLAFVGATPPAVTTLPASDITSQSALLHGEVNPDGFEAVAYFEWGLDTNYGSRTPIQQVGAGTVSVPVSQLINGLNPGTTYHYRAVASNSGNLVLGADQEFTTLVEVNVEIIFPALPPPTATTDPATNIAGSSAQLNGTVNPEGTPTRVYFEWGTDIRYGNTTALQDIGGGSTALPVSDMLSNLSPETKHHFRVVSYNAGGLTVGGDQSFTTQSPLGTWATKAPMPTARHSAASGVINGKLYVVGGNTDVNSYVSQCCSIATLEEYEPTTNTWVTKSPMPTARHGAAVGVINGKLYVAGGSTGSCCSGVSTLEVYDPTTNTWASLAPMPTPRWYTAAGVIDGKLYVVGGCQGGCAPATTAVLEVYDPTTNIWTTKASMAFARGYFVVEVINGLLYAVGGCDCATASPTWVEVYNPSTNTWTTKAPIPTRTFTMASGVIDGKLYVVDGPYSFNAKQLLMYDPATDTWTTKASMLTHHTHLVGGVINGRLYAVGGITDIPTDTVVATNEVFTPPVSPNANTWATKAPMPTARHASAFGVVNGVLYVAGGCSSSACSNWMAVLEAYDPVTNTWATKAPMPTARNRLSGGVVNGIFYAVGGFTDSSGFLATVEAYNPATNTWTAKASMPTARWHPGVAEVNGILYTVGGQTSAGASATLEAYDPVTNTWTTKAPMPTVRQYLATGVINGILYAAGGRNSAGVDLDTVEAYDPVTNTWTTKASMPTARVGAAAVVINGLLYAVGGNDGSTDFATVEAYDPVTNTWTTKASMPTARTGAAAVVINDLLYVAGGRAGATSLATLEAFIPP